MEPSCACSLCSNVSEKYGHTCTVVNSMFCTNYKHQLTCTLFPPPHTGSRSGSMKKQRRETLTLPMSRKDSLSSPSSHATPRGEGGLTISMRALNGEINVITLNDNHYYALISLSCAIRPTLLPTYVFICKASTTHSLPVLFFLPLRIHDFQSNA